jgi:membrane-bound lytic murein transglycosylase B
MTLLAYERAKLFGKYLVLSTKYKLQKIQIKDCVASWLKNQFVAQRLASFAIITAMLPITVSPVIAPKNVTGETYKSNIVIDINKATLLSSAASHSEIVPGESQVQRTERENAEAQAKARAEAEARAQLAAASRNTVTRERRVYNDPSNFDSIYARAEAAYGVDARLLRAVHMVETGGSGSTSRTSYAGAQGPMQFLPSTWRHYGVDANGDGVADINNVEDAIFSAAKYLKACGYPDVRKALWGYNPSTSYYNKVMSYAHSYGM